MFPWGHPSPQPKWHLDRFSRFCTAHDRVPIFYNGPPLPQKIALPMGYLDPIYRPKWFLRYTWVTTQTASPSVQPVLQGSRQRPYTLQFVRPFPQNCPSHGRSGPNLLHGSLSPPEPRTQTVSSSAYSCFCRAHDCDGQTDRPRYCNNMPHLRISIFCILYKLHGNKFDMLCGPTDYTKSCWLGSFLGRIAIPRT